MSLERPIEKAKDTAQEAISDGKVLCPWLPDPPRCPHDKSHMDAVTEFVVEQGMPVPIWRCDECGYREYRHGD
jgi:hypothetical protein